MNNFNSKKILTICIPTYNRAEYLKDTLAFLADEVSDFPGLKESIDFVISDNFSSDDTAEVSQNIIEKNPFINYKRNDENLGLVGNLTNVAKKCHTPFIWFISDDDHLEKGVIKRVLELLITFPDLNFILLNYSVFNNKAHELKGYFANDKNIGLKIFRENYGSLLFITSCVYRTENINDLQNSPIFNELAAPLMFSLYSCSLGNVYITEREYITFNPGNASYASLRRVSKLKFTDYIQILKDSENYGYDRNSISSTIKKFLENQSHAHLVYLFIEPLKAVRLFKYYSFRTFLKFPKNCYTFFNKAKT